ncbi:MAG: type II secretion system GspH family protein [Candidatus Moranbacteria bacterium]|nr:type II secretion system GspH family protein [Candidatus Moranbacteria bacterium]
MNYSQKRTGFTLIEILVVVAIISIMAGVILANVNSGRNEEAVDAATRTLVNTVRELQQYALTGKQFSNNTDPCLYQIAWTNGASTYTTTYYYKDAGGSCSQSLGIATFTLPGGVLFSGTGSFGFTLPYGKPNFGTASVALPVTKAGSVSGVVCAYKDGLIKNTVGGSTCP